MSGSDWSESGRVANGGLRNGFWNKDSKPLSKSYGVRGKVKEGRQRDVTTKGLILLCFCHILVDWIIPDEVSMNLSCMLNSEELTVYKFDHSAVDGKPEV
jgi:hypothetical protein